MPTNGIPLSAALLREVRMAAYLVDFRGFTACPCLAEWLPFYEAELHRRGTLDGPLRIYQLVGNATQSGGTHSTGGAFDVTDLVGDVDVWVARQMGADASWARTAAQGFTPHIHGVLRGCPHNTPARYQIAAVDAGFNGLGSGGRGAPDDGPRPLSKRTWREGIGWALEQQEERDMAEYGPQILAAIERLAAKERERNTAQREREKTRHEAVVALLMKLEDDVRDDATKKQVRQLRLAVDALAVPEPDLEP